MLFGFSSAYCSIVILQLRLDGCLSFEISFLANSVVHCCLYRAQREWSLRFGPDWLWESPFVVFVVVLRALAPDQFPHFSVPRICPLQLPCVVLGNAGDTIQ